MHTTSSQIVAQFIAQSPEQLEIFSQCGFDLKDTNMVVDTPSPEILNGVRLNLGALTEFAIKMNAKKILLSLKGVVLNPLETSLLTLWGQHAKTTAIPLLPQLNNDSRAIVVARMSDHKVLLATSELGRIERVNANELIGDDLTRFNIPEVFDKYLSDLLHHQFLDGYEMPVLDGLGNKKQEVVRAWLTTYNSEIVRVVQVLDSRY